MRIAKQMHAVALRPVSIATGGGGGGGGGGQRQRKKGKGVKIEKKRRKIVKRKVEYWKWKVEKLEKRRGPFKPLKYVLVYQNGNFLPGKSISKSGKITLPPQKNFPVTPLCLRHRIVLFSLMSYPPSCSLYSCSPRRASRKLWTVYEMLSCMQQLRERYASRTCFYARALLWCQRQGLNYAQSHPTVSSTLMHRF